MITAKLHQLIDAIPCLSTLSAKNLPVLLSFNLSKVIKKVNEEAKLFEEARVKKASELGSISEDGKEYVFSEGNRKKFNDELRELLLSDISVNVNQVKISELIDVQIEPRNLALLDWLIVE